MREAHKISRLTCNRCGFVFTLETGLTECPYDGNSLKQLSFDPILGQTLDGKYHITSQIGSGGMSLVYKANQLSTRRLVAVKMLQAYLRSDEMTVLRFKQEILAMSTLQHANVVSIIDHGVTAENQPYLVMDYVAGLPLSRLIKDRGRLDWKIALPVFIQICDGLEAAHARGIVHRDIKPGNIMIIQQGLAPMQARVVDFGIAKLMYGGGQRLTKTGEVIGSPLYMSPEQCTGEALDHRTDMYALACVMHETLTGRPPLAGLNAVDMMKMHLQTDPPSLSVARPECQFPPELEEIILRMLAKRPDARYDSLLTVREQLHALALRHGVYTAARATIALPDDHKAPRRGPGILAELLFTLLVVVLLGAGVVLWALPIADAHRAKTLEQVAAKQEDERDYENARRSLEDALILAERLPDKGASQCRLLAHLTNLYEKMGVSQRADRTDEELARVIKANTIDDVEVDKFAMQLLGHAEEKTSKNAVQLEQLLNNIDYGVSMCLAKARPQIAEELALKGLELQKSASSAMVPASRLEMNLARAYLAQEKVPQAESALAKATAVNSTGNRAQDEEQRRKSGAIAARVARILVARGLDRQARQYYELALRLGKDERDNPVVMREYADYLNRVGETARSEQLMRQANSPRFPAR